MPSPPRRYLSTTEMVTGLTKRTNAPIPHVQVPGDFRVHRPTKHDVLCGRGKPIQEHTGNVRMRQIITLHAHRYAYATKQEKQQLVEDIVRLIQNSNGILARFLQRVGRENYWVIVPDAVACHKVSHGLRCLVRKGLDDGDHMPTDGVDDESSVPPSRPAALSPSQEDGDVTSHMNASPQVPSHPFAPSQSSTRTSTSTLNALVSSLMVPNPPLNGSASTSALSQLSDVQLLDLLARQRLAREISMVSVNKPDVFILARRLAEYQAKQQHQEKLAMALLSSAGMVRSNQAA